MPIYYNDECRDRTIEHRTCFMTTAYVVRKVKCHLNVAKVYQGLLNKLHVVLAFVYLCVICVLVNCGYRDNTLAFLPMNRRQFKSSIGFYQALNLAISVSRLWMDLLYGANRVFQRGNGLLSCTVALVEYMDNITCFKCQCGCKFQE